MNFLHIEQKYIVRKHSLCMERYPRKTRTKSLSHLICFGEFSGILYLFVSPDPAVLPRYSSVPIA